MSPIHEHAEDDLTVPPTPDLDGPLKEDSDPLLNQTSCFPEDKKNWMNSATQTDDTICEEYYGTDAGGWAEREEKAISSNQIDTTAHQADKKIWTPLMGWISFSGLLGWNSPGT